MDLGGQTTVVNYVFKLINNEINKVAYTGQSADTSKNLDSHETVILLTYIQILDW